MLEDASLRFGKYILNNPIRHLYAGVGAVEGLIIDGISQVSRNNFDLDEIAFMTLAGTVAGYGLGAVMDAAKYVSDEIFERNFRYII